MRKQFLCSSSSHSTNRQEPSPYRKFLGTPLGRGYVFKRPIPRDRILRLWTCFSRALCHRVPVRFARARTLYASNSGHHSRTPGSVIPSSSALRSYTYILASFRFFFWSIIDALVGTLVGQFLKLRIFPSTTLKDYVFMFR